MTCPLKVMKRFLLLILLVVPLAFTSCEQEDWPVKTDQTVLMYLPWSSNLKSYFETNISDFESVVERNILKNERVVVFFCTSPTEAVLFELAYDNGKCIRKPLKIYHNPAFTTATGITSILNDVKTLAPANRYAMTIGCHGMGWIPVPTAQARSIGQKKHWEYEGVPMTRYFGGLSPEYQTNTTTLAEGIANAGIKMEYILFDDCYMASVEVAYDLKEVTDYLIASPCEIMAYGMPYAEIGPHLLGKVNYESICDAFYEFYKNYEEMPCGTIGVTVCSELENLAVTMKEINNQYTLPSSSLYTIQTMDGYTPTLFFDCGDYVAKLCTDAGLLARFEEQLERTIPYKRHTDYYYTMNKGKIKINTFSGATISDPSTNSYATEKYQTAWYKATH